MSTCGRRVELKKVLLISVGTGTGSNKKAAESLAGAIAVSVKDNNPTKTFFVASKESRNTLELILPKITCEHEIIELNNPDNVQRIYEELKPKFAEIKNQFNHVTVDFTSGTKAMASALSILSTVFEVDTLSYITGKRKNGVVIRGTEEVLAVHPTFISSEKRLREAKKFFNECRYDTALVLIESITKITANNTLTESTALLRKAATAYSAWDKFQHDTAFKALKSLRSPEFNKNKSFLGKLLNAEEKEPYWIADLINNAKRRGDIEHKFDDAVARLYRTVELIAQFRLRKEHKIEPSKLYSEQIPSSLREKWGLTGTDEKIKIGLEKDYELLAAKEDIIGKKFIEDAELRSLLSKRNFSILAHGLEPLNKKTYRKLLSKTIDLAQLTITNLNHDLENSCFVTLPD
jgi:hypothetical protein